MGTANFYLSFEVTFFRIKVSERTPKNYNFGYFIKRKPVSQESVFSATNQTLSVINFRDYNYHLNDRKLRSYTRPTHKKQK